MLVVPGYLGLHILGNLDGIGFDVKGLVLLILLEIYGMNNLSKIMRFLLYLPNGPL